MITRYPVVWSVCLLALSPLASAETCRAVSGPHTNALVELYTSEGCSSCPPADAWLSQLKTNPELADRVVPLAYHVDYWDYIGWQDRFAQPSFAKRQQALVSAGRAPGVYTPQVAVQGTDDRSWSHPAQFKKAVLAIHRTPAKADIALTVTALTATTLNLQADITSQVSAPLQYFIALKEHQLETAVKAGENRGAVLHHDDVVRQWLGPFNVTAPVGELRSMRVNHRIPLQADWKKANLSVVAVVQQANTGDILQALALNGCGNP